jgi:hypothetical protein
LPAASVATAVPSAMTVTTVAGPAIAICVVGVTAMPPRTAFWASVAIGVLTENSK